MATRPDTARETVNEATNEAIGATSEAARRTLQSAQDAMRTTRAYLQESTEGNRKLFNAYARGVEAAIKGSFEVQNALMVAGLSFLDTSTNSSRDVVQQWTEATRQAQQAALEVWQASAGAGDRLLGPFFTIFSPPHPTIPAPVSPSQWYVTHYGGLVSDGPARLRSRRDQELAMRTGLNEPAVAGFEQVRAAAQRRVAELGHGMQWMTWGCPPHTAGAVCVFCGRELLIARTRQGLFHLDGDALGVCVPSTCGPLDVVGTTRQML